MLVRPSARLCLSRVVLIACVGGAAMVACSGGTGTTSGGASGTSGASGTGAKAFSDCCTTHADCASGYCSPTEGYCTQKCDVDSACPVEPKDNKPDCSTSRKECKAERSDLKCTVPVSSDGGTNG